MAKAIGLRGAEWCALFIITSGFLFSIRLEARAQDKTAPAAVVTPVAVHGSAPGRVQPQPAPIHPVALLLGPRSSDTALGQQLYDRSVDGAHEDPFNWVIHIYKGKHRLEIYYENQLFRVYPAVFGRSRWAGGKQWEGDSRTPEGSYLIVAKHRSDRFDWFLRLNYPNATDQQRFHELLIAHELDRRSRLGGQIGIHGTDSPVLNNGDVNWTLGCISVNNSDIDEMARLLPVGTLVVINP